MFSSGVTDYLLQGSCSPSAAGGLELTCGSIITAYAEMGETKDFIVRSYLVRSYFIRSYFVICPCSFLVASIIRYTESKSHFFAAENLLRPLNIFLRGLRPFEAVWWRWLKKDGSSGG